MHQAIAYVLEALAVGDALGMPTEFMTQQEIKEQFGLVDHLLRPEQSRNHSNLPYASVTDDTEQNFYLIRAYCGEGEITPENTARWLMRWVVETGAVEKRYIGPSSLKALKQIEDGVDPREAGMMGTTCGAMMRTPAAVLCSVAATAHALAQDIIDCAMPTHYTETALSAACGYGFALQAALLGKDMQAILAACAEGFALGTVAAPYTLCAADGMARLKSVQACAFDNKEALMRHLYTLYGTGLESEDIFTAVMSIFLFAGKDVWLGIQMGASIGGDTDTIAALVGALCAAYAKGHNIPQDVLHDVETHNALGIPALAEAVLRRRGQQA